MRKFQYEIVFLLWCTFGSSTAMELDQYTKMMATYGEFNPEKLNLRKGEFISLPWEGSTELKPPTKLNLRNCKGTIDKVTFSKLPELRHIYFDECNIDHLYPNAFSTLEKLETIGFGSSHVHFENSLEAIENTPLENFKDLRFRFSTISNLNKKALHDLSALDHLIIDNSEVTNIDPDSFDDLKKITHLAIKTTKIPTLDVQKIAKLRTLKYLALHDLETKTDIDYNLFKELPNLDTILFDTLVYGHLDFDGFPKLKKVEIGLGETRETAKFNNALYREIRDRIDALEAKGIENQIVRAGKDRIVSLDRVL